MEIPPEDGLTTGTFFKTKDHLEQALAGSYNMLRSTKGFSWAAWVMTEMRSDNTHFNYTLVNRARVYHEVLDYFLDDSQNRNVSSIYQNNYTGIARVNSIIANEPDLDLNKADSDRITGQAKFLRAMFYFDLVRFFGGVPLYLDPVLNVDNIYLPRSSVQEVYDVIIADLKDAVVKLPLPVFPQDGRATRASAKMLLADVYMTLKNYQAAENELKEITEMDFELLPEYSSVFKLSNKNSKESIFEIQFMEGNQGQNGDWYPFLPASDDLSKITGIASMTAAGVGDWNIPTQEMIESYEPNDKRLDVSIGIVEGTGVVGYMVIEKVLSVLDYVKPEGKLITPYIKKYVQPHQLQHNTDNNFPVYRYSEVLLAMAEVLNEQNKSSEALNYLNQVRSRARLAPVNTTNPDLLSEIIAHERRIELAFENKRWFDLLRTGKAIEIMNLHGDCIKEVHGSEGYLPSNSYNVTEQRLLYPIPYREIEVSKLQQNPGY